MKARKVIKRKFKQGSRVVFIGVAGGRHNGDEPRVQPGERGTVEWEYYGGGGEFSIRWDATAEHQAFRSHEWAHELDWEPIVDQIARLA